jgi:hypothetical protein
MRSAAVRLVRCGMSGADRTAVLSNRTENGMSITMKDARRLLSLVARTEPLEYSCDEIVVERARLADGTASESDARMVHHLSICGNCADEMLALTTAADAPRSAGSQSDIAASLRAPA